MIYYHKFIFKLTVLIPFKKKKKRKEKKVNNLQGENI